MTFIKIKKYGQNDVAEQTSLVLKPTRQTSWVLFQAAVCCIVLLGWFVFLIA